MAGQGRVDRAGLQKQNYHYFSFLPSLFSFCERCNTGGDYFRIVIEFLPSAACRSPTITRSSVFFFLFVPAGLRGNDIDDDDGSSVLYLFSVGWSGVFFLASFG